MKKIIIVFCLLGFSPFSLIYSQGFLKREDQKIFNGKGEEVILRGMGLGGWMLQIAGHYFFEHNLPSTHRGWITYQLTGVIDVCEQYGELLARRGQRKAARRAAVRVPT